MKIVTKPASYSLTGTVDAFGANKLALDLIAMEASSKRSFGFAQPGALLHCRGHRVWL